MTKIMDRVIDDIQTLSEDEKNHLTKFLITNMDESHDEQSDKAWANLAKQRLEEIESGKVQTTDWNSIKQKILS